MRGTIITGVWWRNSSSIAGAISVGSSTHGLPAFGVVREVHDHAVERRGHRVEPAEQQQVRGAEQLVVRHRAAVDLAVHDRGQQPVVGVPALLLDAPPRSTPRSPCPRPCASPRASSSVSPAGRIVSSRHFRKSGRSVCGKPIEREEDRRRQRRRELVVEVALAARREAVDDLVHERARFGLELGHALRRELRDRASGGTSRARAGRPTAGAAARRCRS